ncbi:type IV pilus modification PilV family protein [Rhodocyclaceae bacterium SMB388]
MASSRRRSHGFTLIEALVSVAIMGFGLMALSRFQTLMIQGTGFNREQTIAVELAEARLEAFRSFETLAPDGDGLSYATDITDGSDELSAGLATFSRNWTVVERTTPGRHKAVRVGVAWVDAHGVPREVEAATLISANNPHWLPATAAYAGSDAGGAHPPFSVQARHPAVPVGALDQGDGTSVFTPPGAVDTVEITLDNITGEVTSVERIDPDPSSPDIPEDAGGDSPPDETAYYLLAGHVGFDTRLPGPVSSADSDIGVMLLEPTGLAHPDHECWDDSATPAGLKPYPDHISYVCIVAANALATIGGLTRHVWSGRLRLSLDGVQHAPYGWGSTHPDRVCRYAATPDPYEHIDRSLANQNYVIVSAGLACPDGTFAFQP